MPDRPKRRKNNKNKRKNKNSRPDANKNINSDVNNLSFNNSETCDDDNVKNFLETDAVPKEVLDETVSSRNEVITDTKECQNSEVSLSTIHSPNEDWNNNSNQLNNDPLSDLELNKPEDVDITDSVAYIVESPDQPLDNSKTKLKNVKSKSLDNDDTTNIVEITENTFQTECDDNLASMGTQNLVVSHFESDPEWEKTDELNDIYIPQSQEVATGTLSVTTIPLTQCNVARCEQNQSLTTDEEKSLRSYLKTLNLVTEPENINAIEIKTEIEQIINQEIKQRLRKKGLADDFFLHRLGPPRVLDVIDEEGSSESSLTSRRQSYLSERKSDVEDLEDDVFENNKNKVIQRKLVSSNTSVHKKSIGQLVPQECVLVGAKLKEPEVTEARGEWTMKTVEKMTGAEVVYLTDTSSSSSSLHEIGDEDDDGVETDVSVRMMTPTIEVTDPENFLKKTFVVAAQSGKENELLRTSQNNTYSNADKEKYPNSKKNEVEHVIKIEYADDKKAAEIDKTVTKIESECNLQQLDDISTPINKNLPDNESVGTERNINIEIEKNPIEVQQKVESSNVENLHEIIVSSTDDIKTNLYVKEIDPIKRNQKDVETLKADKNTTNQSYQSKYDLETKIIKCEFNDAINNLIKEVTSDSEGLEETPKDLLTRKDSSSSVDSSQCTAKYNPNYESLNDISNILHDENSSKLGAEQTSSTTSHVKDVFDCVTGAATQHKGKTNDRNTEQPLRLTDICVRKIASLPYGDKILEELASVSQRLQNFTAKGSNSETIKNQDQVNSMPYYRLPDISAIEKVSLPTKVKDLVPPPIQPRHSSLKKSQDDEHWTGVQTKSESVYVCLSPSQKMLMDKTNTIITKEDASHLVDIHSKFVDRRGYNESYKNEKQREEEEIDSSPIVPFKSQTGSRLLALIRDPSLTRNINSLNDRLNNSLDELQIKRSTRKTFEKNNEDEMNITENFSFKPIPPPRPKKYSNSFYESDESSDFTENTMRALKRERKIFHYSTGNLNKEIEDDVSAIQNMHRNYMEKKDVLNDHKYPRRPSLPKDLCEQQMEYIRRKEKEVEAEIQRLEALKNTSASGQRNGPRAPILLENDITTEKRIFSNYSVLPKKDIPTSSQNHEIKKGKMSSLFSSSQEELVREKMYSEYITQMAEREERKQHKVIKITKSPGVVNSKISKSMSAIDAFESKVNNRIEKEFISKARERWDKLGIKDPETEDERESAQDIYKEPKVIEHKIKVIEGGKEKDVKKLPTHLQEFVGFTAKDKEHCAGGSGESKAGPVTPHLVILCAVIVIVIAVGKYFFRLLRYN
ncbi:unnamed protein product [Arctia plantaginis]|uniref:Uncharacterized protein n=1 Tax=Arctia plantaginis TaxID=874455 RepID=A0A8S0ZZT7_ARCPL|nr:unnamed protein product [Arctia plantaginis]